MLKLDRSEQVLLLNGIKYTPKDIMGKNIQDSTNSFEEALFQFLKEWFNDSQTVTVCTSGSTGDPKRLDVEKGRMIQSAYLTCSFLGLNKNDSALLCMPLEYIGGKMFVVRALVAGFNLCIVQPSARPFKGLNSIFSFVAMTPMQVFSTFEYEQEYTCLQKIKHLIIGGSSINKELEDKLIHFPHAVWSTYGMTETLSHIALRRISGKDHSDWYRPFKGVEISLSEQETLIIKAPMLCSERIITNDLAEINDQGWFRILGRKDNVIISGGIKIQVEQVEEILQKHIHQPFIATSVPHAQLGECLVLLIKNPSPNCIEICKKYLPTYWHPKKIIEVEDIPRLKSGKIDRVLAKKIAERYYSL